MHYVIADPTKFIKHKFGITFPDALLVKFISVPLSMKNSASTFHVSDAQECTTWLAEPTGWKNTSSA
jgi:hypothetical protein